MRTAPVQRFQVVPAAFVLLMDEQDRVLLSYRQGTGWMDEYWACGAAGHVEELESVFQAAVREAYEELGVVIRAADLIPLTVVHRTSGNGKPIDERVDFYFTVRNWEGPPRIREPEKASELQWAHLNDLPEPTIPYERFILEQWAEGSLSPITAYGFPE